MSYESLKSDFHSTVLKSYQNIFKLDQAKRLKALDCI